MGSSQRRTASASLPRLTAAVGLVLVWITPGHTFSLSSPSTTTTTTTSTSASAPRRLNPRFPTCMEASQPQSTSRQSILLRVAAAAEGVNGVVKSDADVDSPSKKIRMDFFEKARTVTSVCTSGTLCTLSAHPGLEGSPFGSYVDYVLDDDGNPVFLMNDMSMHTINVKSAMEESDQSAATVTLFTQLGQQANANEGSTMSSGGVLADPDDDGKKGLQDVSRCSVTGRLEKIDPKSASDMDALRMRYSITHAYADQVMDSPYFSFYRLIPSKIYFVGGFGVSAKWIEPEDYRLASPDILARDAGEIVQRINRHHSEDLRRTAQHVLGVSTPIEKIRMTSVDRLGMDLRVTSQMGTRRNKLQTDEFRVGFRVDVISVEDAKSEILKVFQEAWEIDNGLSWDDDETPGADVPTMKIAADSLE